MNKQKLLELLALEDFSPVYRQADKIRKENVGDEIQIRAIVEFSNYCRRECTYCGLNCSNGKIERYRMTEPEIVEAAKEAYSAGYKTLVMQSGEDIYFTAHVLGEIVKDIKGCTDLIITVSCGEMSYDDYKYLKECGADKYLLKHETSDPKIYSALHPESLLETRIQCLKDIKALGYDTGSGFMIGLPGQTLETIAEDILLLKELGCDMAGIGPFIPNPDTKLSDCHQGSVELTKRAVALTRIILPKINLPATTALGVIDGEAKSSIFSGGANVIMKKVTPNKYKDLYEIYPTKLTYDSIRNERLALEDQIRALGRVPL